MQLAVRDCLSRDAVISDQPYDTACNGRRGVLHRRAISACLDILFVAKSLERIGDHAKNIGEHVVFAAMGKDVRHTSVQELERLVQR